MDSRRNITTSTLPQEIIDEEILTRLSVKSLLKFRCVSISWRSLIDSKQFIKTHHQNSMKKPSFPHQSVIIEPKYKQPPQPLQYSLQSLLNEPHIDPTPLDSATNMPLTYPVQVLGCCNGLFCILTFPANFFMWNPSTRISKKLPQVSTIYPSCACDSGFGWLESSGEYKVFVSFINDDFSKYVGNLYSSKKKSWKTIGQFDLSLPSCQVGLLVGEKLHWCKKDDIVFLDLKSEVFGSIKLPVARRDWGEEFLGVLGGCLSVLYYNSGRGIEVWVMKDSWVRVVTLNQVLELLHRPLSAPSIVGPNGEILVFFGLTFLVYSPQENVFRFLRQYGRYKSLHLCVERLESPQVV